MADVPKVDGPEEIAFQGRIVEVVKQPMKIGDKKITFEFARRSPGTRLIIVNKADKKLLISKEFRTEYNDYDYRLPGGKVFDSLEQYNSFIKTGDNLIVPAQKQAIIESKEETGITPESIKHFYTSVCGATVTWDLYYFVIDEWVQNDQDLGEGEDIMIEWLSFKEAERLALNGSMGEDRSVAVLLRWLSTV